MKKILAVFVFISLLILPSCARKEDVTEVTFSTWGSQSEVSVIKELISDFEKENPSIKIKLLHIPDNYFQKLHLLVASDLTPDVIFINNLNARIYIMANKLEPLSVNRDDFLENSLEPLTYHGNVYAIPRDISNMVVYYNKDLFDKYGVAYPQKDWSLQDFLAKAQDLTKDIDKDGKTDLFGFGFEKNSLFWLPFLLSNGGGIISSDEKHIIFNRENSINAIQFYSDLRNKYHVAPKADEQALLTSSQLFLQGKVAMHLCGRWCSMTYKKNADFNWDVAVFPKGSSGSVVGLDTSGWAISSSSNHKIEAKKFVDFISSDKSFELMTQSGLIFPARKSVAYSKIFTASPPKNTDVFFDTLYSSLSTPLSAKYTEINDILNEELEPLFAGHMSAREIINNKLIEKLKSKLD